MTEKEIISLAKNGTIYSKSKEIHFKSIVPAMNAIGAHRQGARPMIVNGVMALVDIYVLPGGTTIAAGYSPDGIKPRPWWKFWEK